MLSLETKVRLLVLLSVMFQAGQSPAGDLKYYRVKKSKGSVQYQMPLTAEWRLARENARIADGSILQVQKGGSITLDFKGSLGRTGAAIRESTLTINRPIIVRLTEASFRRIQMDPKLISGQPDLQTLKMMKDGSKLFSRLLDAWKQDASTLSGTDWINDESFKLLDEALKGRLRDDPVTVSAKVGKISLISPKDRQVTWARDLPADLSMSWHIPEKAADLPDKFNVFVWKGGEGRRVYAVVKGNHLTARLPTEGKYFVQVESIDGSYKSELRSVSVNRKSLRPGVATGDQKGVDDSNLDTLNRVLTKRVKLIGPQTETYWISDKAWPLIEFTWQSPEVCRGEEIFTFVVTDLKQRPIYSEMVRSTSFQWQPPPEYAGGLAWHVETVSCKSVRDGTISTKTNSNARTLHLVKAKGQAEALRRIAQKPKRAHFVLDLNSF